MMHSQGDFSLGLYTMTQHLTRITAMMPLAFLILKLICLSNSSFESIITPISFSLSVYSS